MTLSVNDNIKFRAIRRSALVYLLLLSYDKPVGETEVAVTLDIDVKTARSHLQTLEKIGYVARVSRFNGYILTCHGRQIIHPGGQNMCGDRIDPVPGPAWPNMPCRACLNPPQCDERQPTTGNAPLREGKPPASKVESRTTTGKFPVREGKFPGRLINIKKTESSKDYLFDSVVAAEAAASVGKNQTGDIPPPESPDSWTPEQRTVVSHLEEYGIKMNHRTRKLVDLVTTEDIRTTYQYLVDKSDGGNTGLFVHILENKVKTRARSSRFHPSQRSFSPASRTSSTEGDQDIHGFPHFGLKPTRTHDADLNKSPPGRGESRALVCIRILTRVTGWVAYPGTWDRGKAEEVIWGYFQDAARDEAAANDLLRPYLKAWLDRGYYPANPVWLTDWAATRFIPPSKKVKRRPPLESDTELAARAAIAQGLLDRVGG
jgi:hypothetical protein